MALRWTDPDRHALGRLGEDLIARELRRRGWRVEGRRLRTAAGELDLVATRAEELLVVEVKTRRAPRGARLDNLPYRPGESVGAAGRARLARGASRLAARLERPRWTLVLAEVCAPRGEAPRIELIDLDGAGQQKSARRVSPTASRRPNR